MPSVDWNRKFWQDEYEKLNNSDLPYYGAHWGDPNPLNAFPRFLRWLPEGIAAQLLDIKPISRRLHARRRDNAQYRPELYTVLNRYLRPYMTPQATVLEIGPGGGRWTEYLLGAATLTLVDVNAGFFDVVRARFPDKLNKVIFYETSGFELNAVPDASIDFVFSFGTFVHIEPDGIDAYLDEIARVLKPGGHAVIQYADKDKPAGEKNRGFSNMNPAKMEAMVTAKPQLKIMTHDTTLMWHSSVIVLQK